MNIEQFCIVSGLGFGLGASCRPTVDQQRKARIVWQYLFKMVSLLPSLLYVDKVCTYIPMYLGSWLQIEEPPST